MQPFDEINIPVSDGYESYGRFWSVEKPRGIVLYHHGIQSHCGWFESSPARLVEAGFSVLQVDRRGCGRNTVDRGHADSADQLIEDARLAADWLRNRTGMSNYHVIGVSWGGRLAVAAYVEHPEGVFSLSLVTPGLFPLAGVSRAEKAKIGFSMLYEPKNTFDIPLNDPELFTASSQWQSFFRTDPLTLRKCTASFYLASRRMDRVIARLSDAPPVPVHLMLASQERIIDNDRTAAFLRDLQWENARITTYTGARHSMEFEEIRHDYFRDLTDFILRNS